MNNGVALFQLCINKTSLILNIHYLSIIIPLVLVGVIFLKKTRSSRMFLTEITLNIPLGSIGTLTFKQSNEVMQIAHKAWAELATRKAGVVVDLDNDVVVEIYDSWYELFSETRNLVKTIPVQFKKYPETQQLTELLVDTLNKGLRPHLTIWQAKFRRWYDLQLDLDENSTLTPQQIQKKYPEFEQLSNDLVEINKNLVQYTQEIQKLFNAKHL